MDNIRQTFIRQFTARPRDVLLIHGELTKLLSTKMFENLIRPTLVTPNFCCLQYNIQSNRDLKCNSMCKLRTSIFILFKYFFYDPYFSFSI